MSKPRQDEEDVDVTGPILDPTSKVHRRSALDEAIVVVLHPASANPGRRFTLGRAEHVVGRRSDLDLPLDLDSVSRRHARFGRENGAWFVEDLVSTNGTFVNDDRVDKRILRDGDLVRFGEAVVKFLSGSNIEVAYHEEIYRISILDGLTGVHNKRFFDEFLEREVARSHRHADPLAVVMIDIDHFKLVNDTWGHPAGDSVLQGLCRRLKARIRREDLLARVGGEEFAAVLPDTPLAGALGFAEQLRALVERDPFLHEAQGIPVTISAGVAVMDPGEQLTAEALLRRADDKLYEAKRSGRNRVEG